jgi:hypothetical protein
MGEMRRVHALADLPIDIPLVLDPGHFLGETTLLLRSLRLAKSGWAASASFF